MRRRGRDEEDDPFAALGSSSLGPTPANEADDDEDDFPDPSPSRSNVLAALAIADDETDLDMATYYVQRAIAESLLMAIDLLASQRDQPPQ
jgi:hypothetical protein